jgi:hypothetical protein
MKEFARLEARKTFAHTFLWLGRPETYSTYRAARKRLRRFVITKVGEKSQIPRTRKDNKKRRRDFSGATKSREMRSSEGLTY